eukprot:7379977-Prymnesium_polylepis.1
MRLPQLGTCTHTRSLLRQDRSPSPPPHNKRVSPLSRPLHSVRHGATARLARHPRGTTGRPTPGSTCRFTGCPTAVRLSRSPLSAAGCKPRSVGRHVVQQTAV